ncbi:MAG: hypothetical protein EU548_03010 [Promethearchaeota archaeon]|nr:MAG: hypothetical protein EU548_03010 [Candidatus Lokiarchaeota archaeon]
MEIEKKRETTWKFNVDNGQKNIEMTSIEVSGIVRWIKLALINEDNLIEVKMTKEEFFNFLSLTSAFRDVVIGEENITQEEHLNVNFNKEKHIEIEDKEEDDFFKLDKNENPKSIDKDIDDLDPTEWDPW